MEILSLGGDVYYYRTDKNYDLLFMRFTREHQTASKTWYLHKFSMWIDIYIALKNYRLNLIRFGGNLHDYSHVVIYPCPV